MITINDHHLHVVDQGDGEAIVFLPGLGGTTSMYEPQAQVLSRTHRVIRIDPAGAGLSSHPGPLSVTGWADDVVAVLDRLEIDGATVVAHSLGTLVAADLAVGASLGRVRSVVALGAVRAQPDPVRSITRQRAATARAEGMAAVADAVVAMAVSERVRSEQPVVAAFVRESLLGQDPEGYAACCEALATASEPRWSDVTAPVCLVGGDDDRLSVPEVVDTLEAQLTDGRRVRVPGAGHWLSIEQPDLVTALIGQATAR